MVTERLARKRGVVKGRLAIPLMAAALAFATLLCAPGARAQVGMRVDRAPDRVRVDGMLREWGGVPIQSVGGSREGSLRYALAHDGRGLYVVARVGDDRIVRTARPGRDEDAVVLTLAVPSGRRLRGLEVWLYPGVAGKTAAAVAVAPIGGRPKAVGGAQAVEAPWRRGSGYDLEAFVPWNAIGGSDAVMRGRGAIRLHDVDSASRPRATDAPASAEVNARALDRLPELVVAGSGAGLVQAFLAQKGLAGARPRADLSGDVAEDRRTERVRVYGTYVVVAGPGFHGGRSYDFLQLPVQSSADVKKARLVDLTADGKDEILLLLSQHNERGARLLWMAYGVTPDGIRPVWGVEVRKETDDGFVADDFDVLRQRRGAPILRLRVDGAKGLDASNYHEAEARDLQPILLPWGPLRERRYQWQGSGFAVVGTEENPDYEPPEPARRTTRRATRGTHRGARRTARAPTTAELLAAVRKQRGIPSSADARFARDVNLAEDDRAEHLVVYGNALVVVGPGFKGGQGYFYYELPVSDPADLRDLSTVDLTGNGQDEVILRIWQHFDEGVSREVLLAYCFHGNDFRRILALEVAREQNGRSVDNRVKFVRDGRKHDIVVSPGRARGFDARSWPFADGGSGDGVEPLLLPWRDAPARYGYVSGKPGISPKD